MKILAHRGAWKTTDEKNSFEAIMRAFENGWGIETDIRDYSGQLVISHDIATADSLSFEKVLCEYASRGYDAFLAINIKADGLQSELTYLIDKYKVLNYAVFDMSIPEQVVYRKMNIPFFARQSEIEEEPIMYEDAFGIWMDEWEHSWINGKAIEGHLKNTKMVGIISPEIHGRDNSMLWNEIRRLDSDNLLLCTDEPWKASEAFNGKTY